MGLHLQQVPHIETLAIRRLAVCSGKAPQHGEDFGTIESKTEISGMGELVPDLSDGRQPLVCRCINQLKREGEVDFCREGTQWPVAVEYVALPTSAQLTHLRKQCVLQLLIRNRRSHKCGSRMGSSQNLREDTCPLSAHYALTQRDVLEVA